MILNVSGRCDIVAFFSEWFINRYKEGYVDVRNPFFKEKISRIYFSDVDAILFCTKNPIPIVEKLQEIDKPILFHVTLTPYKKDIEPNVPSKKDIIKAIKKISKIVGIDNLYIRYDPIFINDYYTVDYHIKAFDTLCNILDGYVSHFIVSFIDDYKNVRRNKFVLRRKELSYEDYRTIGINFSNSAKKHNMTVQTCAEDFNLVEFGFIKGECLSKELAEQLTGKTKFKKWSARRTLNCKCVEMVDIGEYNSCRHYCKYCYANYDEEQVEKNMKTHDKNSSLLLGKITDKDIITIRKNK